MFLISQILNNLRYLNEDFIGFSFNFDFFTGIFINSFFTIVIILISYLLGRKFRSLFIKTDEVLIDTALGDILLGTGMAILGTLSLLYKEILLIFLILLVTFSILPFSSVRQSFLTLFKFINQIRNDIKYNKFVFIFAFIFIFLAFLRLPLPEIREDQYHTDLPAFYLRSHTIMIPSREPLHVSASPLLAEMTYLIPLTFDSKETTRYLHFSFYILCILTLYSISKLKGYGLSVFSILLFASAPEVIRETSSQYVDFQWIFFLLLSIYILIKYNLHSYTYIAISGLLFGAMLATKLWTTAFIPIPVIYLLLKSGLSNKGLTKIFIFLSASLLIPLLWYVRAYILTGNPLFPAFSTWKSLEGTTSIPELNHYLNFNGYLFSKEVLNVFSPLFLIGIIISLINLKTSIRVLRDLKITILSLLFVLAYSVYNYPYGRYLLAMYTIVIIPISIILHKNFNKNIYFRLTTAMVLTTLFFYYFINTLITLPYAFGMADKNKYLTRILSRDSSSYYDFAHSFDKYIKETDLVATYGIFGYYYANFDYIDINYIFDKENKDFNLMKKKGATRLFINGGDMDWFCKRLSLNNCNPAKYKLISHFSAVPYSAANYYLYKLK